MRGSQTLSLVRLPGLFKHLMSIPTVWFRVQFPAVQLAYMLCIEKWDSEKKRREGWVVEDEEEPCDSAPFPFYVCFWVDKYITQQCHLAIVFTTSFPDSHESAHTSSADTTVVNTYTPAQSRHAKAAVTCNFLCILTMNCNDSKQADRETHMQREVATENIHFVPAVLYPWQAPLLSCMYSLHFQSTSRQTVNGGDGFTNCLIRGALRWGELQRSGLSSCSQSTSMNKNHKPVQV